VSKLELIRAWYDYNEYANKRVLDAAAQLSADDFSRPQGASFDSVEGNLAHIMAGQVVWLDRWRGGSNRRPLEEVQDIRGLDAIRAAFEESHADLREFTGTLTDETLDEPLSYTDSRGNQYDRALWKQMLHVGNHGSYHRAETTMALTLMGKSPGNLDYSHFETAREAGYAR
jgi:uncharacterized damage-inducible protein DinB